MGQIFFKLKFEDENVINREMFREINEIVGKIRFEGYGRILAPRFEYYNNGDIVNDLGNKMYLTLYLLHGDEQGLRNIIGNEIKNHGYNCSFDLAMPNFIEIVYDTSSLDNPINFENELKVKIKECGGIINEYSNLKDDYDFAVTFRLQCQMNDFDDKLNVILNFLKKNIDDEYFIEYF